MITKTPRPLSSQASTLHLLLPFLMVMIGFLSFTGCASTPERHALPPELMTQASIPGIPEARFWGDEWPKFSQQRFNTFTEADFNREFSSIYGKPHHYLAISGGGANGVFGAGLLKG